MAKIEAAIIAVGLLMLERIPRTLLIAEGSLQDQYQPALQEFIDSMATQGQKFEPPAGFRQAVIDHLTRFLQEKGMLR